AGQIDIDSEFVRLERRKEHEEKEKEYRHVDQGEHLDVRTLLLQAPGLESHHGLVTPLFASRTISSRALRLISLTRRSIRPLSHEWIAMSGIAMMRPVAVVISASAMPTDSAAGL